MKDPETSDEEWVITSEKRNERKKNATTKSSTSAAVSRVSRVIRSPPSPKADSEALNTTRIDHWVDLCRQMNSDALIKEVVDYYKDYAANGGKLLTPSDQEILFHDRLHTCLHDCPEPCIFIVHMLESINTYFGQHSSKYLTPRYQRLLGDAVCTALDGFLHTKPANYKDTRKDQEKDLIMLAEDNEEPNLIIFDDIQEQKSDDLLLTSDVGSRGMDPVNDESDEEDEDEEEEDNEAGATITLAELMNVPPEVAQRYKLTLDHQKACVDLLHRVSTPILIFNALDTFSLTPLLRKDGEYAQDGVLLCNLLLQHSFFNEGVSCIRRLDLYDYFALPIIVDQLISVGQPGILSVLYKGNEAQLHELLDYIHMQLSFTFAGTLGIVDPELLEGVKQDLAENFPLMRIKERHYQKNLASCGNKVVQQLGLDIKSYYFLWLSQRYTSLRWMIGQRTQQQLEENDMSIAASANYNGLVELMAAEDPALAKLVIKECVDIGDTVATPYFASRLGQQEFYCRYSNLPLQDRAVGILKGEYMSPHRNNTYGYKHGRSPPPSGWGGDSQSVPLDECFYVLPPHVQSMMVDSKASVQYMRESLAVSRVVGLDSEWVPQFAHMSPSKTALLQIASKEVKTVFLVDIKTLCSPDQAELLTEAMDVVRTLFEHKQIVKLAYDFRGDMTMIRQSIKESKSWKMANLVDLKDMPPLPGPSRPGGLAGLVLTVLGIRMNKKQQLSNWELRPLTDEQTTYAASDAQCLIDVYTALISRNDPRIMPSLASFRPTPSTSTLASDLSPSSSLSLSTSSTSSSPKSSQLSPTLHQPVKTVGDTAATTPSTVMTPLSSICHSPPHHHSPLSSFQGRSTAMSPSSTAHMNSSSSLSTSETTSSSSSNSTAHAIHVKL